MSETHALRSTAKRLQDIQESLNVLLITYEADPEKLQAIHASYQAIDHMQTLAPEDVDSQLLSALEEFVQGENASSTDTPPDETTLNEKGMAYIEKFHRSGDLRDLEGAIASWQRAVDLTPDTDDGLPIYLSNLGAALLERYEQVGSIADLDAGIMQIKKVASLTADDHPNKPGILSNLGHALLRRFDRRGSLTDLEDAMLQGRKAVSLSTDDHVSGPNHLNNLGNSLRARYDRHGSLTDLEDAISQQRKAVDLTPDSNPRKPTYLNSLGNSMRARYNRHGSLTDLEDTITLRRKAVDLTPDGHPSKAMYLNNLGDMLQTRFDRHGSLADVEEAISRARKAIDLTLDVHTGKPGYITNLGNALLRRFGRQGSLADLEEAILQKRRAVNLIPHDHPSKPLYLNNIANALQTRYNRQGSLADLEDAISQQRMAVDLTPDDHPQKAEFLNNLGHTSAKKFNWSDALPDLDESILHWRKAIQLMPNGHPNRVVSLISLSRVLKTRFERLGNPADLQTALSAGQESAETLDASSTLRLRGTLLWAECCTLGSNSPLPAFEYAIKLLPRIAWLGLAVDDQYQLLAKAGSVARDAVAAAIAEDDYATAMKWAEQGRSIVWQNLLSLRTPLEELQGQHPELSARLQELSQSLEHPAETQDAINGSKPRRTANNQMTMAMERDKLIDEVRSKPGFENFMTPKSLEQLAPAARDGAVIFLNLGETGCDALALLPDDHGAAHVLSIPLERVTLQDAEQLSQKLVDLLSKSGIRARDSRKYKVLRASDDRNAIFKGILKTLWFDYVQPILDGLAYQINLESPPRLWWCTTGPGAFLPLHAAGLYDTNEAGSKLSDYVVSSYTPTLTALLEDPSPVPTEEPKILTVAISNTPGAPLPCTEEEIRHLQRLAANLPLVTLTNEEATRERVLEELEENTWVHLACHGEQVGGKPMESGIILHDGKLRLSEIVKTRLPNAEFAFLSACQTAVGDGGVPEESAHLAAGMLFAGYRGVVATMWSIQDDIAPRVAEDFYRYLFRRGQPKREEAAFALHRAVRSLQESKVPFASWVPFIHIGR